MFETTDDACADRPKWRDGAFATTDPVERDRGGKCSRRHRHRGGCLITGNRCCGRRRDRSRGEVGGRGNASGFPLNLTRTRCLDLRC